MARKLKNALAKYQAEQKIAQLKKSREQHAVNIRDQQRAAKAAKTRAAHENFASKRPWLPFEDSHDETVVFVGEGDFSFAESFMDKFPNTDMIGTSLDSRDEIEKKYGEPAVSRLQLLEEMNVPVLHEVDAKQLSRHKELALHHLKDKPSITVVFNFPHLGNSVSDQDRNIRQHQQLILGFFEQCKLIGAKQVVMSLFDGEPYNSWQPKQLARSVGYKVTRSARFPWDFFSGYQHQLTAKGDSRTSKSQRQRDARIYLWTLQPKEKETS